MTASSGSAEAELNRCADGETNEVHCLTYGINDGMPTIECSEGLQPAGCRTADGRLWFPTSKGLVAVDPLGVESQSLAAAGRDRGGAGGRPAAVRERKPVIACENSAGTAPG